MDIRPSKRWPVTLAAGGREHLCVVFRPVDPALIRMRIAYRWAGSFADPFLLAQSSAV